MTSDLQLIQIAQVLKSNGTEGETVLGFRDFAPDDIDTKEPVFICFDGLPVPFFIESFSKRGNSKALVRLTDITTFDDAREIVGQAVYGAAEVYAGNADISDDLSALVGWTLLSHPEPQRSHPELGSGSAYNTVGTIIDFLDIPNNPCIEVETKNGAVTIPLHEDLIVFLDPDSREICMTIPEGLL